MLHGAASLRLLQLRSCAVTAVGAGTPRHSWELGGGGGVCSQLGMGSKQRLLLAAVGLSFDFYPLMEGRLQGESGV